MSIFENSRIGTSIRYEEAAARAAGRFGVSWQIVPTVLRELLGGDDPERSRRVMTAILTMKKIDGARLRQAYDGR